MKYVQDEEIAEDIIQDVFYNIWNKRDSIDFSKPLKPYLFRSVYNYSVNHLKSLEKREKISVYSKLHFKEMELSGDNSHTSPYNGIIVQEIEDILRKTIEELPTQCKKVFQLSRISGLKNSEIASELNITPKGVEKQITKALAILRKKLAEFIPAILLMASIVRM